MKKKDMFGDEMTSDNAENFEEMFARSEASGQAKLKVGASLKGEILSVGKEEVFVSTGTPVDGVIPAREFLDKDKKMTAKVGDVVDVVVVRLREDEILLRRKQTTSSSEDIENLEDAFDMELPVVGRVLEAVKGGFRVDVQGRKAFCPMSQMDFRVGTDMAPYMGKKFDFIITKFDPNGRDIVVSRRKVLDLKRAEAEGEMLEKVKPGDYLDGEVTRLEPYGAFVRLEDGIEGLAHISELSWSRLNHASQALTIGQQINVKVLKIEELDGRLKLSLSVKQGKGETDPWSSLESKFPTGTMVDGTVEKKEAFGLFLNIAPGITGLLPKSKWRDAAESSQYENKKKGDVIKVRIEQIDLTQRRLSLGLPGEEGDESWRTHASASSGSGGKAGLGTLADLFKKS